MGSLFDGVLARGGVPALVDDAAWLRGMLAAEVALARALAEVGLMTSADAEAIYTAADADGVDVATLGRDAADAGNPVVPFVRALTARVRDQAGDGPAGWVHYGATSQDVMDTAAVLVTRAALGAIEGDLRSAAETAAGFAQRYAGLPMAGRTLLQHAVPVTFGLKAAGWLVALDDAAEIVRSGARRLPAQLGGAAGTLASLGEHGVAVLSAYARHLDLPEPVVAWHTARLPLVQAATAAATAAGVAAKVAGDIVLMSQTEVGEVAETSDARGGSSTMPHKRNPVAAVAALAGARQAPGLLATLLAAMGQEHERAAGSWHAEWQALRDLLTVTGSAASWLSESLRSVQVDPARMRANLDATHGMILAERVSTALRPTLGRLPAHDVVAEACRRATSEGRNLLDVLLDTPAVTAAVGVQPLRELLDPAGYLGSAEAFVQRALRRHAQART